MGSFNVGTLTTAGCDYTCTISYDNPTRSGDKVKIKNVKATITSSSQNQTRNRIAVSVSINGTSKAYNKEVKRANQYDDYWPTSAEVTIVDSNGFEFNCLDTSFSISATFRSTGYGSSWDNDNGSASKSGSISCPERTYSVTFNANGGSGAPAAQSKTYNVNLTLSSTVPTYSGFAFKGWSGSNGSTYQAGSTYTGNANLSLTAIWQALTTDLEDIDDIEIGDAPEIAWTPQSASLTYKLKLSLGEWSWESDTISPGSTNRYVYDSYTVPLTVCEQLPNSTSELMKCVLTTYNSGEPTGTSEKYFTVTVPDTVVPTISDLSITDGSENALSLYLQNFSWVKATMNVAGAYGSNVESASLTVGDDTVSNTPTSSSVTLESYDLDVTGSISVSVSITDSRGRTATATSTITVYAYERPAATISMTAGEGSVNVDITPTYSEVTGNSATYALNGGTPVLVENGETYHETISWPNVDRKNYEATVVVTDAVTFCIVVATLYPGKGDRFETLSEDDFYVGMDDKGWKDTESEYDGGIDEDGVISFTRLSGEGPVGVGIPIEFEADSDYELIYSVNRTDDNMTVFVSFFKVLNDSFVYISSTYIAGKYIKSGETFHTPKLSSGSLWGIVVLGDQLVGNTREYSDIVLRKIDREEESLAWEIETGILGLDTPNQKYISRVQMRIDYVGSLKVEIAYDNESTYKTVHESTCDHMRSITVPIKVKRNDHFRIRLSGTGQTRLYSFGFQADEGGARCLI